MRILLKWIWRLAMIAGTWCWLLAPIWPELKWYALVAFIVFGLSLSLLMLFYPIPKQVEE